MFVFILSKQGEYLLRKIILIVLTIVLCGCSNQAEEYESPLELEENKPSIKLINSNVKIVSNNPEQSIVDGKLIDNVIFVSLKYDFTLENISKSDYKVIQGPQTSENDVETITLNIEPSPGLKALVSELTGVDLFSEKNNGGSFSFSPSFSVLMKKDTIQLSIY